MRRRRRNFSSFLSFRLNEPFSSHHLSFKGSVLCHRYTKIKYFRLYCKHIKGNTFHLRNVDDDASQAGETRILGNLHGKHAWKGDLFSFICIQEGSFYLIDIA